MPQKGASDEQLGQLAAKQAEYFRRVKEGTIDPEKAAFSMQALIEGRHVGFPHKVLTLEADPSLPEEICPSRDLPKLWRGVFISERSLFKDHWTIRTQREKTFRIAIIQCGKDLNYYGHNVEDDPYWDFAAFNKLCVERGMYAMPLAAFIRLIMHLMKVGEKSGINLLGERSLLHFVAFHAPFSFVPVRGGVHVSPISVIHKLCWMAQGGSIGGPNLEVDEMRIENFTSQYFHWPTIALCV